MPVASSGKFRFTVFSMVGVTVFILGTGFQWALIRAGAGPAWSYAGQAVFSVELSFALNRWLTWRDRTVGLAWAAIRWNTQKLALSVPNFLGYGLLILAGLNWLAANVTVTAAFTIINYAGGDLWSFRSAAPDGEPVRPDRPHRHARQARPAGATGGAGTAGARRDSTPWLPSVSVVIPCKDNPATIRPTVLAILAQDYPELKELILVGSPGDSTWPALADLDDPRLAITEQAPRPGQRDPSVKRDAGIRAAKGEVVALADSDITMDPDWLARAVRLLDDQGRDGMVCGGMRSIHDSYWGRFVDQNVIAAKTPRVSESYLVTAGSFGRHGRKPPITANVVFAREVYDHCPIDDGWTYGYEDYEWFWRIARAGYPILYAAGLEGAHHHRRSFRALAREYLRSADGCARFIRTHPDSPLARKRRWQAIILPPCAVAAAAGCVLAAGYPGGLLAVAAAAGACLAGLAGREVARSRTPAAVTYPVAGLALAMVFTVGLTRRLLFPARPATARPLLISRPGLPRTGRLAVTAAFGACLAAGAALRFLALTGKPGWQYDEGVYSLVARNLLRHGTLNEHITYHAPWTPFLYQPIWYPLALSRWFALTGPGVYHARVLGVLFSLATMTVLFRLLWRSHGPRVALAALIPVVFDGWLLYVQRISYIENALLLLVTLGMLCYQRALDQQAHGQRAQHQPSWPGFALAGAVLGFAVCVKFTGAYVLVAVLLCWLILRRAHRGHLVLLAVAAAVIAADQAAMVRMYDVAGHDWYLQENLVQLARVLGLRRSGGSLTSPLKALHLLAAQYRVFLPSLLVAVASLLIAVRRLLACCRARSWAPLRANALLFSWLAAGVAVFGLSSLRYPQYFGLILLPMYGYLWTELWQWDRSAWRKAAVAATVAVAGLCSFWLRVPDRSDNVFAQVQQYAAGHIPAHSVVVTEETIGDLIGQPYCRVEQATACAGHASYAITWATYLQSSFQLGDPAFRHLMRDAKAVRSFSGFSGTATVWRLQ